MSAHFCFFTAWGHYLAGNENSCHEWLIAGLMCLNRGWNKPANQMELS